MSYRRRGVERERGNKTRGGWSMLLPLCVAACTPPSAPLTVASLAAEARANELHAVAAHSGEELRVTGVVTRVGLKKVNRLVGERTLSAPFVPYSSSIEVSKVLVSYPYAYLQDPKYGDAGGRLLCFFLPRQTRQVGDLTAGGIAILRGDFQSYSDRGNTIVLQNCEIESQ